MATAEEASTSDEGHSELQIELRPAEGGYAATVRWPNGETTSLEQPLAVEPSQVDETLARVGRGKSKWIARDLAGGSLDPVRALGEQLFRSLIEGGLGSRYHQAVARAAPRELRVCLATADRRLADLPWELLYDLKRQDFVALSVRTPLVRRWLVEGGDGAPAEAAPLRGPLRVLVVDASGGASGARSEIDALYKVGGLGVSDVVKAASASQLLEAVARGTEPLLHFIGPPPDVEPPPEG
ncbi:MAG TPA: hypothetical protein VFS00_09430, partial [Polyangiaceae bacterium]|nr:hypothetical protein [Polyangiaceae bacterium]